MPDQMNSPIRMNTGASSRVIRKLAPPVAIIGPIWSRISGGIIEIQVDWKSRLQSWPMMVITQPISTANRIGLR